MGRTLYSSSEVDGAPGVVGQTCRDRTVEGRIAVPIEFKVSAAVDDRELSALHHRAFGSGSEQIVPWGQRLNRYSIFWVTAEDDAGLVGFVNVVGDGGVHAFILDTVVSPERQGEGIGRTLIQVAASEARDRGCAWLHVDFEPELEEFYFEHCGFRSTQAGLLRLSNP